MILKGLFLISRPLNSFLSGFAVIIGAITAITHPLTTFQFFGIILGYFTTSLIAIGGYAINDVFDKDIDKINMPHRPIPAGYLTELQGKAYAFALFIVGILLALIISLPAFIIAVIGGISLFLYAAYFKRSGLIGNLIIGFLTAIPFIFGGFLTGSYDAMVFPALFAFLLIVGREIIKDIEDVHGDKIENVQSIALRYGVKPARSLGYLFLVILLIIVPIPIILGYYRTPVFVICVLVIILAIFYVAYLLFNRDEGEIIVNSTRAKKILKSCISLGVFAFVFEGSIKLIAFGF